MSGHTPAPWEIQYGASGRPRGINAPNDAGIPGAVGCVVRFNGIGMPSSAAGLANALLISAAPDLLDALKEAALIMPPNDGTPFIAERWRIVSAALAKAEGK